MSLSIIVLNYNTKKLLKNCLNSILNNKWKTQYKIFVVDNASSDGSVELIKKSYPLVDLAENKKNLGYSKGNNIVLRKIKSDYYLLLNSDTELQENSLDSLIDFAKVNDFGICSCKLINFDGSLQPNAGDLPNILTIFVWLSGLDDIVPFLGSYLPSLHRKYKNYYVESKRVGWVSGTAMLIKNDVLQKIGFLDEKIFMYAEDIDLCLRAKKAGFKIGWFNETVIKHLGGGSSRDAVFKQRLGEFKGLLYVYRKHFGSSNILKLMIFLFSGIRAVAFFIIGREEISKAYAKILYSL